MGKITFYHILFNISKILLFQHAISTEVYEIFTFFTLHSKSGVNFTFIGCFILNWPQFEALRHTLLVATVLV